MILLKIRCVRAVAALGTPRWPDLYYTVTMRTLAALLLVAASLCAVSSNNVVVVATAGTPVRLSTTPSKCIGVVIQALPSNTGHIYVGFSSTVASTNAPVLNVSSGSPDSIAWLPAGNAAVYDLSQIWINSSVNGEGVTYACQ